MSTLMLVVASVWVVLALLFTVGLCVAAKRRPSLEMAEVESKPAGKQRHAWHGAVHPRSLAALPTK